MDAIWTHSLKKYGNTDAFIAKKIEPGHVYEVGYPKCVCEEVLSGNVTDVSHCECSRNSILCILQNLLHENEVDVETIPTILGGTKDCTLKLQFIKFSS